MKHRPVVSAARDSAQQSSDIPNGKPAMDGDTCWRDYNLQEGVRCALGIPDPLPEDGDWLVKEEERPEEWSSVWLHFTQHTTFHGINKITEQSPFKLRRFIWMFIVLGGLSLFLYQMVGSILHYLEHPVTVNTRIIYNKTLVFPAVTVCNQNVFRISEASRRGYYDVIDKIYSADSMQDVNLTLSETNVTLKQLYDDTAHRKQDMIASCIWDRKECQADDFSTSVTDHGVCYTFNSGQNGLVRMASQTGSDRGLRLKVNIEQYEYMRGPQSAAGVKILIHDRTEVPLVRDFGQAASPGSHAFVGVQMTQINNLEPPYGECGGDLKLQFYDNYTIPNCLVDCKANFLRKTCGCRLAYMPEFSMSPGEPPVCSFADQKTCVDQGLKLFEDEQKNSPSKCECPVPCSRSVYDTTVSYGTISQFDTAQEGRRRGDSVTRERFIRARETVQRVDKHITSVDKRMVRDVHRQANHIEHMLSDIWQKMKKVSLFLDDTISKMEHRMSFHMTFGLKVVKKAIVYGYVQAWDIDQQNYFEPLSSGTKQLLRRCKKSLETLLNVSTSDPSLRRVILWHLDEELSNRRDLTSKARSAFLDLNESFLKGTPTLRYNWSIAVRYDKSCVPKALLRHNQEYQSVMFRHVVFYMDKALRSIHRLRHFVKLTVSTNQLNETRFRHLHRAYMGSIKQINYAHNLFKDAIVYKMRVLIDQTIADFSKMQEVLKKERNDVRITTQNIFDLLTNMRTDIWPDIKVAINASQKYTTDMLTNKTSLAGIVTSDTISARQQQMGDFFTDVRARARNLDHDWRKVRDAHIKVWKTIKSEPTTQEFYQLLNHDFRSIFRNETPKETTHLLQPFIDELKVGQPWELYYRTNADMPSINETEQVEKTKESFALLKEQTDILSSIDGKDDNFLFTFHRWRSSLVNFIAGSEIDERFLKENFLQVDVYMKELYYELVEQRIAYDLTNLWSDIGGSMGLFVGASVITFFELIDALLQNFLKVQLVETKQRRRSLAIARSISERSKRSNSGKVKDTPKETNTLDTCEGK